MAIKPVTLRLPESLYEEMKLLAKKTGESLNTVITSSLQEKLKRHAEEELWASFTRLGTEDDEAEVESAIYAQSEVVLGGD